MIPAPPATGGLWLLAIGLVGVGAIGLLRRRDRPGERAADERERRLWAAGPPPREPPAPPGP